MLSQLLYYSTSPFYIQFSTADVIGEMPRFLLLLMTLLLSAETCRSLIARRADDKDFEVVSDPHACKSAAAAECNRNSSPSEDDFSVRDHQSSSSSCTFAKRRNLDALLKPYYLITHVMPTQADTFRTLSHVHIMSVPVPTYHMKQPTRLSSSELEFQLVLVKDLTPFGKSNIQEVLVDPVHARDSWFLGYYWSPLVLMQSSADEGDYHQHVGWKFTAAVDASEELSSSSSLPHFYALMIELKQNEKEQVVMRLAGFQAPGWMAQRIIS